jgi:drug/metabolite transporter (DMT)-like permease
MSSGVLFGLAAALAWGGGDFLGGWNSRRLPATTVAFWAQTSSLAILLALVLVVRPGWDATAFGWGFAAGLFTGFGGAVLYRGLATGNAAVVAPLSSLGAVVPVVATVVRGESPGAVAWAGIVLALLGVAVVSIPVDGASFRSNHHLGPVLMGLAAALGFGLFFLVVTEGTGEGRPELTVVLGARLGAAALIGSTAIAGGIRKPGPLLPGLVALGVIELSANGAFALASTRGNLAVISVLASLYPVVTVALARAFTHERLTASRVAGAALALGGAALVSAS